ncbi:energy transducer TonB [uncultured Alistipes sp.]|jgi:hypothetical protein|uniref:energy transducer TonB n=1 Tax=uncultured Alistipes sp. TaxID=538949 RepID=UPI0025F43CEA|nr:energy transducer TonB [uncultured Alistipes sp.]
MKRFAAFLLSLCSLHAVAQDGSRFNYYSDGRAVIKCDSLYGFVDRNGMEVIPCQYRKAYTFNDGIAMVRQGYEVFAIDTMGRRLDTKVKIPQFYNQDFDNFAHWVWRRIPFASTTEYKQLSGEVVNALVIIGPDGRVTACENMTQSNPTAFTKVRDVVMNSPKWTPGYVDGQPVEIRYSLPVAFGKLYQPECYPVDQLGRRLHKDLVYPLFEGEYAVHFNSWFFRNLRYKNSLERQKAASGLVRAAFTIDKKGALRDIEIVSSHNEICKQKTIETLKKSPKWTPGLVDGQPADVRYEVSFYFRYR